MEKQKIKILSIIRKNNLHLFFNKISEKFDVYLPVQDLKNGITDFTEWKSVSNHGNDNPEFVMNLGEKTKKSPKFLLFPSTESLFKFEYKKDPDKADIVNIELKSSDIADSNTRKKIIFGIKPCDISAINMFDLVFGSGEKRDTYYLDKRNSSILISIGCSKIHPDCFCTSVGGHPFDFEHSDIGIVELEEAYAVIKLNENVKWLIEENNDFFEKENSQFEKYYIELNKMISDSETNMPRVYGDATGAEISDCMEKTFDSEIWRKNTKKCISCAACTFVCPTCVCFNIFDEMEDLSGERLRCWDYCMNYYYTLEASGHNPRPDIYQRYRNKINCKYNYYYKRSKNTYCVGCGRCIEVCPVGMDIREIVASVLENGKKAPDKVKK